VSIKSQRQNSILHLFAPSSPALVAHFTHNRAVISIIQFFFGGTLFRIKQKPDRNLGIVVSCGCLAILASRLRFCGLKPELLIPYRLSCTPLSICTCTLVITIIRHSNCTCFCFQLFPLYSSNGLCLLISAYFTVL
jgi:hypothetical protein